MITVVIVTVVIRVISIIIVEIVLESYSSYQPWCVGWGNEYYYSYSHFPILQKIRMMIVAITAKRYLWFFCYCHYYSKTVLCMLVHVRPVCLHHCAFLSLLVSPTVICYQ